MPQDYINCLASPWILVSNFVFWTIVRQQQQLSRERRASSSDEGNWLDKIKANLRMTSVYTMISGVIVNDLIQKQSESTRTVVNNSQSINNAQTPPTTSIDNAPFKTGELSGAKRLVELRDEDYAETTELELTDELVGEHIPCHKSGTNMPKINNAKMTVHAHQVFRALQVSDGKMANIASSFDLEENLSSIQKNFGGPEGGKSGEFFYFSRDRRLMIKTMGTSELEVFLKHLKKYVAHLVLNEDSLIVKIYGLYTFEINNSVYSILIMRNISQCPSEYVERTFDLKGSTFNREVSTSKKNKGKSLREMTLKDVDFTKTEGKIWIGSKMSKKCSEALEKDARFFEACGLIDYSLIVFKINWVKYSINTGIEVSEARNNFHTNLNSIESSKEIGLYYHIGIIDYLQEWNSQKKFEKSTKKIINLNGNLDTSSQNQKIYADRFINEIAKGIFEL